MNKILFLNTSLFYGGAEVYLKEYIEAIEKLGDVEVFVALPKNEWVSVDKKHFFKLEVGSLRKEGFFSNWIKFIKAFFALKKWVKTCGIDIVITNSSRSHLLGYLLSKFAKMMFIPLIHELLISKRWVSFLSSKAICIIYATEYVQKYYSEDCKGKETYILRNSIDFEKLEGLKSKDLKVPVIYNWIKDGYRIIGMAGYLFPWKGQLEFLQLAKDILEENPNIKFMIIGGVKESEKESVEYWKVLKDKVQKEGLGSSVYFTGNVESVIPYMNKCDLIIHGSLKPEPFGRVMLEAIALKKPVLSSNEGGVTIIVPKEYQFDPKDFKGRKEKIFEILKNPSEYVQQFDLNSYDLMRNSEKFVKFLLRSC